MTRVLLSIVLFMLVHQLVAQKFLAVDSRVSTKRWKFYEGDFIQLKMSDNQKVSGYIVALGDSSLTIGKKEVELKKVLSIHLRGHRYGLGILTTVTGMAGIGYFGIDTFNRLINNNQPLVYEGTMLSSGILLSVALISDLFNRKTIKIKESRQIKVLDLSI